MKIVTKDFYPEVTEIQEESKKNFQVLFKILKETKEDNINKIRIRDNETKIGK